MKTRADVRIELIKKNTSIGKIARQLCVQSSAVYMILTRKGKSKRIEDHIEKLFGQPFSVISAAWMKGE